ncbi:Cellobiose 2-epimerase [compost metagenome]
MKTPDWKSQLQQELQANILAFWTDHTVDGQQGGFVGYIDPHLNKNLDADKGLVLNARILWTFASAYRLFPVPKYLEMAERAYDYLKAYFADPEYGGFYWMVDAQGIPVQDKKQVYGQAFVIYALAEYYRVTSNTEVLERAIELYRLLEQHGYDPVHKGYIEALARDWKPTEDLSLSNKDLNEKKSMNTHLHVLEAYTNLYRVWKSPELQNSLSELIEVTLEHIIDPKTAHFLLFFDDTWEIKGHHVSYGHDIEGSWLLVEAAEVLGIPVLTQRVKDIAVAMAEAVYMEGVDLDGGIWNEADSDGLTDDHKDWWPQAEAMVGFYNAYQLTGDAKYRDAAVHSWRFIQTYLVDRENGEWFWGVDRSGDPLPGEPKVSPWKCPYHNSRACLEMLERLGHEQ